MVKKPPPKPAGKPDKERRAVTPSPDSTGVEQGRADYVTRFRPGQSGNAAGRPLGAKNKLCEGFLEALYADWQQNGLEAIAKAREESALGYCKMIAALTPREDRLEVISKADPDELSDAEIAAILLRGRGVRASGGDREAPSDSKKLN